MDIRSAPSDTNKLKMSIYSFFRLNLNGSELLALMSTDLFAINNFTISICPYAQALQIGSFELTETFAPDSTKNFTTS